MLRTQGPSSHSCIVVETQLVPLQAYVVTVRHRCPLVAQVVGYWQLPQAPYAGAPQLVPAGTVVQMPNEPATLQARHTSVQALSQQWPSTHSPLAHWLLPVHGVPFG